MQSLDIKERKVKVHLLILSILLWVQTILNLNSWSFMSNATEDIPCRILIAWNSLHYSLTSIHCAPQWITCEAMSLSTKDTNIISFVYGHNSPTGRKPLWDYIVINSPVFYQKPWYLLGDFNAIIQSDQRSGGDTRWLGHQDDIHNAIHQGQLVFIPYKGMRFTWNNDQQGDRNIQKKLDWVFGKNCTLQTWPASTTIFLPRSISDHSPIVLYLRLP